MTTVDDLEDLLRAVDIDEMEEIETLLMFLFARPIQVGEAWDEDGLATSIHVIVRGDEESIGFTHDFPMSLMELARSCEQTVGELGPYTADDFDADEEGCVPWGGVDLPRDSLRGDQAMRSGRLASWPPPGPVSC